MNDNTLCVSAVLGRSIKGSYIRDDNHLILIMSDDEEIDTGSINIDPISKYFLPITGGTMTGPINMGGNSISNIKAPVSPNDAANKAYTDKAAKEAIARANQYTDDHALPLAGGTMQGNVDMGGHKIEKAALLHGAMVQVGKIDKRISMRNTTVDDSHPVMSLLGPGGEPVTLENVADPSAPKDAVNLKTMQAISGVTVVAACYDPAAPASSTPNAWYVPKTMPRPSGAVGMTVDVWWEHGRVNGLGYNITLIWGEPGGGDNEVIVDAASTTDTLSGVYSIPAEGTVRYQLEEVNGRKHWRYVSGPLLPKQFSSATPAATADKTVPGMSISYLPGMDVYVQLDSGNSADLMRLVPDDGPTLPVYGNGTGPKTGAIPAGAILHLINAGSHWQIINGGSSSGPGGEAELYLAVYGTNTFSDILAAYKALKYVLIYDAAGQQGVTGLICTPVRVVGPRSNPTDFVFSCPISGGEAAVTYSAKHPEGLKEYLAPETIFTVASEAAATTKVLELYKGPAVLHDGQVVSIIMSKGNSSTAVSMTYAGDSYELVNSPDDKVLTPVAAGITIRCMVYSKYLVWLNHEKESLPPINPEDEGKVLTAEGGKPVWKKGGGIPAKNFRVDYKLTKVSSSNRETSVAENASYTTTLTADEGLLLSGVSVTMGGKNITVDAWKEPAVTIASVTGDVVITAEGVGTIDTSIKIAKENFGYGSDGSAQPKEGLSTSIDYPFEIDKEILKKYPDVYDPAKDEFLKAAVVAIVFSTPKTKGTEYGYNLDSGMTNTSRSSIKRDGVGVQQPTNFCLTAGYEEGQFGFDKNKVGVANANSVSFVISTLDADESYAYWKFPYTDSDSPLVGYRAGDIIFAGKNTQYYGLKNIDGETPGPVPGGEVPSESPVMLAFDRAYIDTGVYKPKMQAKWDGMFSLHRGFSTARDNTLQAFLEAKKHGYNCCEMDLRRTSDGVLVLSHDASITGTVNGVSTTYVVASTPWATLKELVVGNSKFPDSHIPSMEETFAFCRRIGMRAEIDYKVGDAHAEVVEMSKRYSMQDDTLHCCYSIDLALAVKAAYEKATLRVGGDDLDNDHRLDEWLKKPGNIYAYYAASLCGKATGSNVSGDTSNETRIQTHKAKGYKMYVWNVTPTYLPDVMQWEPDILQPQSSKDNTDWYQAIRDLNQFPGIVW